ncbi:MAG TPA: DinB family protein [Gemmatimonadaceae bacterium]|nr:DinB family protein [Gemmatimonadaceae bacterium]
MSALEQIRRLWQHAAWADAVLLDALRIPSEPPESALREYAHILGAEEVWLSRIERRAPRAPVWPTITIYTAAALAAHVRTGYESVLGRLTDAQLTAPVAYTNSAGQSFQTALDDILLHVALHGQYHRGKVNLLLRQEGCEPAPTDYIAFIRGVPAATEADARRRVSGGRENA